MFNYKDYGFNIFFLDYYECKLCKLLQKCKNVNLFFKQIIKINNYCLEDTDGITAERYNYRRMYLLNYRRNISIKISDRFVHPFIIDAVSSNQTRNTPSALLLCIEIDNR